MAKFRFSFTFIMCLSAFVVHSAAQTQEESFLDNKKVSPEYWVRIAQAKAIALVMANGQLPTPEETSQLMIPAKCPSGDQQCFQFTSRCAEQTATCILETHVKNGQDPKIGSVHTYMETIFNECGIDMDLTDRTGLAPPPSNIPYPIPVFHCNSYNNLWQTKILTNFRLEYYPDEFWPYRTPMPDPFTNLDRDQIPSTFVIEVEHQGKWQFHQNSVQPYWLYRIATLPQQSYRIRVTAISPKYVYPPVTSLLLPVYKGSEVTFEKPRNLRVVNISVDEGDAKPLPSALVKWESGSGFNASCDSTVYYMHDEMHIMERKKEDDAFWAKLPDLQYDTGHTIRVFEKFGRGREPNVSTYFYIPSCLELRGFSFDLCPPPVVTNIRIESPTSDSFWVEWDSPKYSSEANKILSFAVNVKFFESWNIYEERTIPGNTTSVKIQNVGKLRGKFDATIAATSKGGVSPVSKQTIYFSGEIATSCALENTFNADLFIVIVIVKLFA